MKNLANKTYSNYNKVQSIKASKRNFDYIVLVKVGKFYEVTKMTLTSFQES